MLPVWQNKTKKNKKTNKKRELEINFATFIKKKKKWNRVPFMAQQLMNPTRIHEDMGLIPGLAQWIKELTLP